MGAYGGQYRMNVVWSSHAGQVLTTMGQIQSGMRTTGGVAQRSSRDLGAFNSQMQAIGTTMRYMFAGGAIFGSMNAFRQFAEFESRLGDIAAISADFSKQDIGDIGNVLLKQSTALATPVNELEMSARNIQSTLQGLDPSQVTEFTELFGKGAMVAETDAYNFGNAVMGMRNAFGLSLTDMGRIADEFFQVIQISAGMTGDEWAKFSGRVVAGASIAGASMEQMNALTVLMTRQGATSATNVRHLSQFLMQLRNPTQESLPFWEDIGLDKETLRSGTFDEIMGKLTKAVGERGLREVKPGEIMAMEEDFEFMPKDMGGGESLLMDLFGRMESRRAALVVLSQILNPPAEGNLAYDELLATFESSTKEAENLDKAVERALDRKRIQQAGIALRNALTEAFLPFESQIMGISKKIEETADPRIFQAAAGGAGAYGLWRILKFGKEGAKSAGRFLRGGATGALAVNSLAGSNPTGSFASPFFVVIHPFSNLPGGGLFGKGGGKGGGGGGGVPPVVASPWTRAGKAARFGGKFGFKFARFAGPWAPIVEALVNAEDAGSKYESTAYAEYKKVGGYRDAHNRSNPYLKQQIDAANYWAARDREHNFSAVAGAIPDRIRGRGDKGWMGGIFGHALRLSGQRGTGVHISADLTPEARRLLDLKVTTEEGRGLRKRVGVPKGHNAFQGGATPQFRGNDSVPRGGL